MSLRFRQRVAVPRPEEQGWVLADSLGERAKRENRTIKVVQRLADMSALFLNDAIRAFAHVGSMPRETHHVAPGGFEIHAV